MYRNGLRYDVAGNRTRLEYNDGGGTTTTTYLYNPADQLTRDTVGETNTDYLYDANGSLTKKDDGTNVHSYAYDYRNLMTDYDGPGSSNDSTYKYDAGGRRITKDVDGTKTAYFHDLLNVVAEYNGSNQLLRTYVTPGLDMNLTVTASGSTYYYTSDGLGSIRDLLDSSEVAQNTYDYFAFGRAYGTPTENVAQPFRYTGRAWDAESGFYYYRARNYQARIGCFQGRDPFGPGSDINRYRYAANAPVKYRDPLGKVVIDPDEDERLIEHEMYIEDFFAMKKEDRPAPGETEETISWRTDTERLGCIGMSVGSTKLCVAFVRGVLKFRATYVINYYKFKIRPTTRGAERAIYEAWMQAYSVERILKHEEGHIEMLKKWFTDDIDLGIAPGLSFRSCEEAYFIAELTMKLIGDSVARARGQNYEAAGKVYDLANPL